MVTSVADRLPVKLETVDSNGLYPMRATERVFTRAFSFRNHLQKTLAPFLSDFPKKNPLSTKTFPVKKCIPADILRRWPAATDAMLNGDTGTIQTLPIDHTTGAAVINGGEAAARRRLRTP